MARGDVTPLTWDTLAAQRDLVMTFLRKWTRSDPRCEDWAHDALARAWARREQYAAGNLGAWVCQIARRLVLDERRHDSKLALQDVAGLLGYEGRYANLVGGSAEQEALRSETRWVIRDAVAALEPHQRAALWLVRGEGMTARALGVHMGRTRSAVKALATRGRRRLRRNEALVALAGG